MPHIAVLGANGLIGNALALDLQRRGFEVIGHARQFTAAQRTALTGAFAETPLLSLSQGDLAKLLENADMVVNTIGILQGAESDAVHREFAARLAAVCVAGPHKLLVHLSVPGRKEDDSTLYSRSKREGERAIAASGAPYVIAPRLCHRHRRLWRQCPDPGAGGPAIGSTVTGKNIALRCHRHFRSLRDGGTSRRTLA